MSTIRIALTDPQRAQLEQLIDTGLRARGLVVVEQTADLVFTLREGLSSAGFAELEPRHVATITILADAACRTGGLGMAEIAVGALAMCREARELADAQAEQLELGGGIIGEELGADTTIVVGQAPTIEGEA